MTEDPRIIPGRNPDVGFLHCGGRILTPNISTHTGFGEDVDTAALRGALIELARRAPLLASRLSLRNGPFPGLHHTWTAPPDGAMEPIPLRVIDLPAGEPREQTALFCAEGANRTILPETDPPFQVDLLRHADHTCDLVTTLHHGLYDGASCGFIFYAIKRLYIAAFTGHNLGEVRLPRILNPSERAFTARRLEQSGGTGSSIRLARLTAQGIGLLYRENRFRTVQVPGRETADHSRSLHTTLILDLRTPSLAGLGDLLGRNNATLNELLQAAVSRTFFRWGRSVGLLEETLPLATTFNLRHPSVEEYALGNFETATCVELRREDVGDPLACFQSLIERSQRQKRSDLPLGHYLALSLLARAPRSRVPAIVDKITNRALLLYSYIGGDFSRRYHGYFGSGDEEKAVSRLVRDFPGSGAGYVTSAPPMGLVLTVKRIGKTLALNFSLHSGITNPQGLNTLAEDVREEMELYARLGRNG